MKRTTFRMTGLAAAALTMSLGLAACGADEEPAADTGSEPTSEAPTEEEQTEEMGAQAQTYGEGCAQVPTDGDGSFEGMATAPVASAASANPLLTTLVTAVGEAELVEPLNSAEALTVFAPANPAFEAFSKKELNGLLKDKDTLTQVLTHHVVPEQISPDQLSGEFETLNGDMITINGSGEEATIGDEEAAVLCGNIPTANATVYVIDTVLMP
ncbi:fasciclin domain-containing protein [Nocardioides coralli]|uniref:fasciclin domain-containing protein n=1 Tax=Nocardioides coralli TaxID=2872154 RepID=UPI001CA3D237|nr:fasciclin domain-containing protein [Nocardioides coralli]QZY29004.1 fasciclin domain-containing protein [Nocardioides coralli]